MHRQVQHIPTERTHTQWLTYLQGLFFLLPILYFGSPLFIPMFYGLLIAIIMYPVCKWLEARHIARSIAITISLSIVIALFIALLLLLGWQVRLFKADMPEISARLYPIAQNIQEWVKDHTSFTIDMQNKWLRDTAYSSAGKIGEWIQQMLSTTISTAFSLFLVPIYAALFLFHRSTFVKFLHRIMGKRHIGDANTILQQTVHTYFNYIKGMVMVYAIVGVLNSIGLMALGIKHAILFGMLTAIMTIIPYVGIIVSALLPISMAFITKDSIWYPIGVVLVFSFVQYLEANIIFPKVVGTQLNVSTWATLVAIIAGGIIWGVSGMILFIPFVAILKIVTDNISSLEALNILLNRKESNGSR